MSYHIDYKKLNFIVNDMNNKGLKIDTVALDRHIKSYREQADSLRMKFDTELLNQSLPLINIRRRKDLTHLFFDQLQLPIIEETKTGPSLNKEVLEVLRQYNPLPGIYADIKSTDRILKMLENFKAALIGDRVYPYLKVNGASSGRFTSSGRGSDKINIQQLPESVRDIILPD